MSLERLWRIVRIVGIVEMQPDEKRPLLMTAQPAQRAVGNILGAPLHALVAILSRLALMKMGVIQVKAAVEAGSSRTRIENIGPNERCRVIAVPVQQIRQIREVLAKRRAQILKMTELRIGPGQQSSMRRRGQRNLRVRSRKHNALLGQRIKVGRQAALGA